MTKQNLFIWDSSKDNIFNLKHYEIEYHLTLRVLWTIYLTIFKIIDIFLKIRMYEDELWLCVYHVLYMSKEDIDLEVESLTV